MRSLQYIQFVQTTLSPVAPNYRWWDKPRWWLVKLLGGKDPAETFCVVRVPVDGKTFVDRLFKQRRAFVEGFNPLPTSMLIGAEDYEELMSCQGVTRQFMFDAEFGHGRKIYGLHVTVIPWMRGMVIMP